MTERSREVPLSRGARADGRDRGMAGTRGVAWLASAANVLVLADATIVLVALPSEELRPASDRVAAALRRRGIPTEVSPSAAKYGKQIRFAERRGIPSTVTPPESRPRQVHSVRGSATRSAWRAGRRGSWRPPHRLRSGC